MPGTLVQDALAAVLYNANITSATTTTGSAVEVGAPRLVSVVHTPGTLTGIHTFDIEIQGSDDSGFGAGTVVSYGRFDQGSQAATAVDRALVTYASKRYMRAVIVTAGTVTASNHTIKVHEPHLRRTSTYPSATIA